ncbi:hypothetical protein GCM10027162_56750 [Streptomyces incanus]
MSPLSSSRCRVRRSTSCAEVPEYRPAVSQTEGGITGRAVREVSMGPGVNGGTCFLPLSSLSDGGTDAG